MTQQCCRKLLQIWYAPKVAAAATNKTYKNVNQPDFVCSRCVSCSSFWLTRLSRFLRLKNLSMAYTLLSQDRWGGLTFVGCFFLFCSSVRIFLCCFPYFHVYYFLFFFLNYVEFTFYVILSSSIFFFSSFLLFCISVLASRIGSIIYLSCFMYHENV